MFSLEQAIADWRRQMLAAGIKTPVPLEELEIHLREETEQQMKSGLSEQAAFEMTVRQIGRAEVLKTEFVKAGETIYERLKRFVSALAGIPNYQLTTNMNTSDQCIESRWATYLKDVAFAFPPILLWLLSTIFLFPKLNEICQKAGETVPSDSFASLILATSNFFENHFLLAAIGIVVALVLLEWRSSRWPRYRRAIFGIVSFSLNFAVLALIGFMLVRIVIAGAQLMRYAK